MVLKTNHPSSPFLQRSQKFVKLCTSYGQFEYMRQIKKVSGKEIGKWTKNQLIELGPTFVKIGQFMSTRTDVFGEEITDELKELQDNAAPLPFSVLCPYIQKVETNFSVIEEKPIAAASIGQVHVGELKTGEKVVLKIKRPGIESQIIEDFEMLLFGIQIVKFLSEDRKIREFEILFKEYYNLLQEEVDFTREIKTIQKFRQNFSTKKWIKIPAVFEKISNHDVIVMDYVPSIKIDNIAKISELGFNKEKIAQKLIELYIKQIIEYGLVHIDPHPGNVGITEEGKIVFYDFGMVLMLDPRIKERFTQFLIAVYDKDINAICSVAVEMGLIVVEPEDIPYFKTFLIAFLSYIETADLEDFKVSYISKINISSTPFLVSSKFVLLLRGISILEGVCKKLDPDFNFKKTLDPYINEFIVDINYFEARAMSDIKLITKVPDKVQVNQIQLEVLEKTIRNVEMNVRQEKKQKTFAIGGTLSTLLLDQWIGSTDVPITGIVTCILLTYFVIINGKVYKGRS